MKSVPGFRGGNFTLCYNLHHFCLHCDFSKWQMLTILFKKDQVVLKFRKYGDFHNCLLFNCL